MSMNVLSDRQVQHRADTQGVVVTRVQTVEVGGQRYLCRYWSDWQSGNLHHVESEPVCEARCEGCGQ